jgi:hypothetical protein
MFRSDLVGLSRRWVQVGPLEQAYVLAIAARDLGDSLLARRFFAPPGDQRIPESRAADRKADEARHTGRHRKPVSTAGVKASNKRVFDGRFPSNSRCGTSQSGVPSALT